MGAGSYVLPNSFSYSGVYVCPIPLAHYNVYRSYRPCPLAISLISPVCPYVHSHHAILFRTTFFNLTFLLFLRYEVISVRPRSLSIAAPPPYDHAHAEPNTHQNQTDTTHSKTQQRHCYSTNAQPRTRESTPFPPPLTVPHLSEGAQLCLPVLYSIFAAPRVNLSLNSCLP